jgi:hypothetical protein
MRKGFLKIISPDNSVCPVVPSIVRPASISSQFSITLFSIANVFVRRPFSRWAHLQHEGMFAVVLGGSTRRPKYDR